MSYQGSDHDDDNGWFEKCPLSKCLKIVSDLKTADV